MLLIFNFFKIFLKLDIKVKFLFVGLNLTVAIITFSRNSKIKLIFLSILYKILQEDKIFLLILLLN